MNVKLPLVIGLTVLLLGPIDGLTQAPPDGGPSPPRGRRAGRGGFGSGQAPAAPGPGSQAAPPSSGARGQDAPGAFAGPQRGRGNRGGLFPGGGPPPGPVGRGMLPGTRAMPARRGPNPVPSTRDDQAPDADSERPVVYRAGHLP